MMHDCGSEYCSLSSISVDDRTKYVIVPNFPDGAESWKSSLLHSFASISWSWRNISSALLTILEKKIFHVQQKQILTYPDQ